MGDGPFLPARMKSASASLLLGLCHAGSAAALGLGGLSVHSSLGQPLHASVEILGATTETRADCFSLASGPDAIAPPLRAQLTLEHAGGQARLHIRTRQSVTDPVAQFAVAADCEVRLQRDYVLLLDPPAESFAAGQDSPLVAPPAAVAETRAAPAPDRKPGRDRGPATARPSPATRAAAPQRRAPPPRASAAETVAAPRLVLSGRRGGAGSRGEPVFALRLDTTLPDMARAGAATLSATEMSDENTALSRKLAYLESQLVELERRNAELSRPRPATPAATPPPQPKPESVPQWPLALLAAGLLGGGVALFAWRRRGNGAPRRLPFDADWAPPASDPAVTASPPPAPAPARMAEVARPEAPDGTEVKDGILDQAEVFMAHGHANLAVHLLQEHLRQAPTESPVPWLLLLDLLHREGDVAAHAAASTECRRYFNINLSEHGQESDGSLGIEAYPHLLEQLVHVWNTPEVDTFFTDLIYDHRGGTRMGFHPAAYRDIILLRAIAQGNTPANAA